MPFDDFDDEEFNDDSLRSHSPNMFGSQFGLEDDNLRNYAMDPPAHLPAPRPLLRRSKPIDFSLQYPPTNYPTSQMSGSTLPTHSNAFMFPRKAASSIGLSSRLPVEAIASLTPSELENNPHYCKLHALYCELRDDHAYISRVLAKYLGKDLQIDDEPCAAKSGSLVPDIFRVPNPCEGSRDSSLGPSNSASQQSRVDLALQHNIDALLKLVEPPYTRPPYLSEDVLWYPEDSKTNMLHGPIFSKSNKSRAKMTRVLRRANGVLLSSHEFKSIREYTDLVIRGLLDKCRGQGHGGGGKSMTKYTFKSLFPDEYREGILKLEAEEPILRLCCRHWKAEIMMSNAFHQRSTEGKARGHSVAPTVTTTSDANASRPPEPLPPAPVPKAWDLAPTNPSKCALELSPSPKSPSVSHIQKRTKDNATLSGQNSSSLAPSANQRPAARRLAPTFLSQAEPTIEEPATMNTRSAPTVSVESSVNSLVVALTSGFPSLTSAPTLLRSMNAQPSFKQGKPSQNVIRFLERIQSADPHSPDFDEDNTGVNWGHDQFTAGDLTLSSTLTTWEDVGSVATAFKLVAAALKTCREARQLCANTGASSFISDLYLEKTLEHLKKCWVGAGGTIAASPPRATMTYCDVAKSPPHGITIKIKRPSITDAATTTTASEALTGTNSTAHQQPTAGPAPPSAMSEGDRADVTTLKTLIIPELFKWISTYTEIPSPPKGTRKDQLVAIIVKTPEFALFSKSDIKTIIDKRKPKAETGSMNARVN